MSDQTATETWGYYSFGFGPVGAALRIVPLLNERGYRAQGVGASSTEFVTTAPASAVGDARRALGIRQSPDIAGSPVPEPQTFRRNVAESGADVYPWFDGEPVDEDD
jgi:hypothetical protein